MGVYLDDISKLFSVTKERKFTDRNEIIDLLDEALTKHNEGSKAFQVFSIHGIGGIGKTRLLKEFIKHLQPESTTYISFEIEKQSDVINNLYQFRKIIPYSCPFFDYALLQYWQLSNPSKLDDKFMNLFNKGFFTTILDFVMEITGGIFTGSDANLVPRETITPSTVVDFINNLFRKAPQLLHKDIFQLITLTSIEEIALKLPQLLGIELKRHIQNGNMDNNVFIFDSYQQSSPYSESEEWLLKLIDAAHEGLFIVTSREKLKWNIEEDVYISYELDCYPEDNARNLIEETIPDRPDLVDTIIRSTQCIPIYIDLALDVYEKEKLIVGEKLIKKALFNDKAKLVNHFISHMDKKWQKVIWDLATIRIFNYEIFEYLVKQNMLDCAPYEYNSIIESNLFKYVFKSDACDLIKLHDVFSRDVQNNRPINECYIIYKSYLNYICYRRDLLITKDGGILLVALFQNLVSLAVMFEERMVDDICNNSKGIEIDVVEKILDIYFSLVSNNINFEPILYEDTKTETMKKVCKFIYAKTYEKNNTLETIKNLESIGDVNCFGKHRISYESVLLYAKSLVGEYKNLENWIDAIEKQLDDQLKNEWFYNKIKIYQADCDILYGRFNSGMMSLCLLKNNFSSMDDDYSIHRTIGHIQRFNFMLDDAANTYKQLLSRYENQAVYKEYLITNLIETQCYFPTKNFIKETEKTLSSLIAPYNLKNKAKILYSLAIANVVKKHYCSAQKYIYECVNINQNDGYQSGELFAYMAQAYLDYAQEGIVSERTINLIEKLLVKNEVYQYFRLPLFIMKNDISAIEKIKDEFDWLDFDCTEKTYRSFLSTLLSK